MCVIFCASVTTTIAFKDSSEDADAESIELALHAHTQSHGCQGNNYGHHHGPAHDTALARVISPPTTELLTAHNRAWEERDLADGNAHTVLPPRFTTEHAAGARPEARAHTHAHDNATHGASGSGSDSPSLSHTDSLTNQGEAQHQHQHHHLNQKRHPQHTQQEVPRQPGKAWEELRKTPQNSGLRKQLMQHILHRTPTQATNDLSHPNTHTHPRTRTAAGGTAATVKGKGRLKPSSRSKQDHRCSKSQQVSRCAGVRTGPATVPNFEAAFPSMPVDPHLRRSLWSKYVKHAQTVIRNKADASPHRRLRKDAHLLQKHHQASARLDRLKDEKTRIERLRAQDAAKERACRVRRAVYDRRRGAAQLQQFYSKLHRMQKSKQLQHRTTEELAVRRLFEDYLTEAKENTHFMKKYAKELQVHEQRERDDAVASLWQRFNDQIELLEHDMHQQGNVVGKTSKVQRQEFTQYHNKLRAQMRREIEDMQEHILDEFDYSGRERLRDADFELQTLQIIA